HIISSTKITSIRILLILLPYYSLRSNTGLLLLQQISAIGRNKKLDLRSVFPTTLITCHSSY
ncbi:MAG: hypothetical protein WAQ29_09895, partial [Nitrososphaeraceae archaeon]